MEQPNRIGVQLEIHLISPALQANGNGNQRPIPNPIQNPLGRLIALVLGNPDQIRGEKGTVGSQLFGVFRKSQLGTEKIRLEELLNSPEKRQISGIPANPRQTGFPVLPFCIKCL